MDEDGELLRRYLAGEVAAFDELVRRHQRVLFSFVRRQVRDHATAEDLLQRTFIRMLTGIGHYRHQGRLRSWLFRIAHNLIVDDHRKQRNATIVSMDETYSANERDYPPLRERLAAPDRNNPEHIAQKREQADAAGKALARLAPAQREAFLLRQAGLSFKEIARVQNCPVNTALGRMHDALQALRRMLEAE